jgi:hypothetical protein
MSDGPSPLRRKLLLTRPSGRGTRVRGAALPRDPEEKASGHQASLPPGSRWHETQPRLVVGQAVQAAAKRRPVLVSSWSRHRGDRQSSLRPTCRHHSPTEPTELSTRPRTSRRGSGGVGRTLSERVGAAHRRRRLRSPRSEHPGREDLHSTAGSTRLLPRCAAEVKNGNRISVRRWGASWAGSARTAGSRDVLEVGRDVAHRHASALPGAAANGEHRHGESRLAIAWMSGPLASSERYRPAAPRKPPSRRCG